ncbi:MAG TPA: hypothetical protein VNK24_08140 [Elusimicrobiota bacterium]|nr:hypothetical protein [Elusimicrobiota bacterium]
MKIGTPFLFALSISLTVAAAGVSQAADSVSGAALFSRSASAAAALAARTEAAFEQSQNQAEATLDPKTMSELASAAQKIYEKNGGAWAKGRWWHTRCDIKVDGLNKGGKFVLKSIVIGVSPWKIETKCTTRFLGTGKCLFDKFSSLQMTVNIRPDGAMTVVSDPGYGKHTKRQMTRYAEKYAVGFWLGRFSKPVWNPLF